VKADLYTAHARTGGAGGLAHRTAAGFVVLTSADGDDIIALIEDEQNESDLIDQVVAMAQTNGPAAFAMLFTAGGDMYLVASGAARITLTSPSSHVTMRPVNDQVLVHALSAGINESAATIRLHVEDVASDAMTNVEFQAGTVQAGSVEVAIGGAVMSDATDTAAALIEDPATAEDVTALEPTPAAEEAADVMPEVEPVVIIPPSHEAPMAAAEPVSAEPALVPTAAPAVAQPAPARVGTVMVLGVNCSQGHHNHPDAVYCSQCGTKMGVHHTTVLTNGPRPPLGVLVVDDGTTYSLNKDLVIGREPTSHDDVIAGTASPMILTDDSLSLSRKHARVVLDDWSVAVQDLNSSNGTYISRSGQTETWAKLEPGSTTSLEPGDRLRVGGRIIQVELHHVR